MRVRTRASRQKNPHERWPINAVAHARALFIETPNKRHSVWQEEVELAGNFSKPRLMSPHRHNLRVAEVHCDDAWIMRQLVAVIGKLLVSRRCQRRAEHI